MQIFQETLEEALRMAVAAEQRSEQERGYTQDSAMLSTWKAALEAVRNGEGLEIKIPNKETR